MTETMTYSDPTVMGSWTIPGGVTSFTMQAIGGGGGGYSDSNSGGSQFTGGGGGNCSATFNGIAPGSIVQIYVGGFGSGSNGVGSDGDGGTSQYLPSGQYAGGIGLNGGGGGAFTYVNVITFDNLNQSSVTTTLMIAGGGGGGAGGQGGGAGGYGGGNATFNGASGTGTAPVGGHPVVLITCPRKVETLVL